MYYSGRCPASFEHAGQSIKYVLYRLSALVIFVSVYSMYYSGCPVSFEQHLLECKVCIIQAVRLRLNGVRV